MVRPARQTQPEGAITPEQALVTPAVRPEVLLALQHQQSTQAINNECAHIRQEIGSLQAQINAIKDSVSDSTRDVGGVKRTHHIVIGGALVVTLALGFVWYFIGSKVATLLMMADERQVSDMHKAGDAERARSDSVARNSN